MKKPIYTTPLSEVVVLPSPIVMSSTSGFGTDAPGTWGSPLEEDLDFLSMLNPNNPLL